MKMMQGACFFAWLNISRTRDAPTPTNISTKSEPEMLKNGTLASPAMALASRVLPVPGEPTISTPRGMRPPSFWNLLGSRRNSTSSATSSFASSTPATSEKVTLTWSSPIMRARERPKDMAPLPPGVAHDALVEEFVDHPRIAGAVRDEVVAADALALDGASLDGDLGHLA